MRKAIILPALTAALLAAGSAPQAAAAAPEPEIIPLACSDGRTYRVVVNGNGSFTSGRDVNSTRVVVPISFGDFMFRAQLPDGTVITDSEPGVVESKGKGNVAMRSPRPKVTCTFSETVVLEQEEDGFPAGTTLTFSGSVTGYVTGRR